MNEQKDYSSTLLAKCVTSSVKECIIKEYNFQIKFIGCRKRQRSRHLGWNADSSCCDNSEFGTSKRIWNVRSKNWTWLFEKSRNKAPNRDHSWMTSKKFETKWTHHFPLLHRNGCFTYTFIPSFTLSLLVWCHILDRVHYFHQ